MLLAGSTRLLTFPSRGANVSNARGAMKARPAGTGFGGLSARMQHKRPKMWCYQNFESLSYVGVQHWAFEGTDTKHHRAWAVAVS